MQHTQSNHSKVRMSNYQYMRNDLHALVEYSLYALKGIHESSDLGERLPGLRELFPPALLNLSTDANVRYLLEPLALDVDCQLPPIKKDTDFPRKRQKEDVVPAATHVLKRQVLSSCEEDLQRFVKQAVPGETDGLPSRAWFKCTVPLDSADLTVQTCGYIGEKQTVRRHVRTAHLKLKPWVCSCGREFSQKRCSGITHANTFNGVKNLPCIAPNCNEMFSDAAMRNRHVKATHDGEVLQETRRKSAYVRTVVEKMSLSVEAVTLSDIVFQAKL
ncbi:hypothetical protein CVT24_004058 [Panaeolus cyanescens]|uniref:C2H2-type domain-containing protein n=1 Tax=Panaeolus cyanescens TaxID=181874 RepID=A0A409Y694_9AGAR|nr:hypothetical protein CVT24_004058 [Panaeolus cyanescens]